MSTATLEAPSAAPVIEITDCGPISGCFPIDLSDGPGVFVLEGDKGVGKSTTLSLINSLVTGHTAEITVHDGQLSGTVAGMGRIVPVGSRKRPRGELEMDALDTERFSLNDVTDPHEKTPAAADARRTRAIASLLKIKVEPSAFYHLTGGKDKFEKLVRADKLVTDDPVVLASRIKSELEVAARLSESHADTETGHAKECQAHLDGLNMDAESNAKLLDAASDKAVGRLKDLEAQTTQAARAAREIVSAKETLKNTIAGYDGPTVADAKAAWQKAEAELAETAKEASAIEKQIAELKTKLAQVNAIGEEKFRMANQAKSAVSAAEQHAKLIANCETLIRSQEQIAGVPEEEILAAQKAVAEARAASEQGVLIRKALEAKKRQAAFLESAERSKKEAEDLRSAATSTFDVLARSIKLEGVSIENVNGDARWVVEHPNRKGKKTYFSELSGGERQCTAIDLTLPHLGNPAVFVIEQRSFQELSKSDKERIHAHAVKNGVFVFGAQISEGPLRVERYAD